MSNCPTVSFVIPVRDDAARLHRCLESIVANRYPVAMEIVVADNGSRDHSAQVAHGAGARVLSLPALSVSELRNQAARAATGEILFFIDADHEIVPNWVECAVATLTDQPHAGAVGNVYRAPEGGSWVQRTYDLLRRPSRDLRDVEWLASGNMAVWRTAFERVGGFDTTLETCEDVDLSRRLRRAGYRVLQDPRLRSTHAGDPATLSAVFRGERWRGRDNLRVSLRPPFVWRELPSIMIPVAHLLLAAAVLGGLAMQSVEGLAITAISAVAMLVASGLRATRMLRHRGTATALGCIQAFMVAAVYDAARAAALVHAGGHEGRRKRA